MTKLTTLTTSLLSLSLISTARAESESIGSFEMTDSLELAIGGTYLQSAGTATAAGPGSVRELPGPGAGIDLQLGYRRTPNLVLAFYGGAAGIPDGLAQSRAVTWTFGVKAEWHFSPNQPVDPWLGAASGIKLLAIDEAGMSRDAFGFELAKLQAGIDFRVSRSLAVGFSAGISASMYTAQQDALTGRFEALPSKPVSWTLVAGPVARFELDSDL